MSEHPHSAGQLDNPEVAHEYSDVNVRGILTAAVGLVVVCSLGYVIVYFLFTALQARVEKSNHLPRHELTSKEPALNGVAGPHLEEFDRLQNQSTDSGQEKQPTPSEAKERAQVQLAMDKIVQQNLLPARPQKPGQSKP